MLISLITISEIFIGRIVLKKYSIRVPSQYYEGQNGHRDVSKENSAFSK